MEVCEDCGDEFTRIRQHWAMSDCGPDNPSKSSLVCQNCGDRFTEWTYRVEKGDGKFCSHECRNEGIRTGDTVECSWCGSEVYKPDCHLSEMGDYGIDHHFCDKECEQEWKRSNWVRENHPNWEGGSGGIDAVRQAFAENSWRDTARRYRERHDGGCEICGGSTEYRELDVHHIVPLAVGGTNEDWNLMAVCHSCHRRAESYIRQYTTPHIYRIADAE